MTRLGACEKMMAIIGTFLFVFLTLLPSVATAEWFADLYLGGAFSPKKDVDIRNDTFGNFTLKDVKFNDSISGGGRFGYFFLPWVGGGLDVSHWAANHPAQNNIATSPAFFGPVDTDRFNIDVTAITFDVIGRYPLMVDQNFPQGRLQPYLLVGPGIFIANGKGDVSIFGGESGTTVKESSTKGGVKAGGGATFMITKNIGVFGEYMFTHFKPEFTHKDPVIGTTKVQFNLDTNFVNVGVAIRFP